MASPTIPEIVGSVAAGIAVGEVVLSGFRRAWARTLGRRREVSRRLAKLGLNQQLSYYEEVLGVAATRRAWGDSEEHVWVSDLCFVQAITDSKSAVVKFAVTSRRLKWPAFSPRFVMAPNSSEPARLRLNRTRLGQLPDPSRIYGDLGANRVSYWEEYWFGNPGDYCTYFVGNNDVAPADFPVDVLSGRRAPSSRDGMQLWETGDKMDAALSEYRHRAVANTYGEAAPYYFDTPDDASLGPDLGYVRVLPQVRQVYQWRQRLGRWRFRRQWQREVKSLPAW